MARARKLFPVYGSAVANHILVAVGRGRLVDRFVAAYVAEYDRRGILGEAARDRELAETIGREVVLATIVEVRGALPKFFGKKQHQKLKEDQKQAVDAFFRELIAALERAWSLNAEEQRRFARDLALYSESGSGRAAPAKSKKGNLQKEEPPFIGRVALLLDPSMLEQARRASRKFHGEVTRNAQRLLKQTLRPGDG